MNEMVAITQAGSFPQVINKIHYKWKILFKMAEQAMKRLKLKELLNKPSHPH